MAVTLTLWALLTRVALGLFGLQILLDRKQLGKLFFRVNAWIAAGLLGLALALRVSSMRPEGNSCGPGLTGDPWALAGLSLYFGCLVLLLGYLFALRRAESGWIRGIQAIFVPLGLASLIVDSLALSPPGSPEQAALVPLSAVTSSLLLGSALLAMMLGHWYLVIANLSIRLLERVTIAFVVCIALRAVALAATVVLFFGEIGEAISGADTTFVIFLSQRVLFGILGPAAISILIWKTVKMRSTQSATGLLYVAIAFVLVGEGVAGYLLFWDGLPV